MLDWNILVTARAGRGAAALRALRRLGAFWPSGFRDVFVGQVEDPEAFLGALEALSRRRPAGRDPIAKAVPIERTFDLSVAGAPGRLAELIKDYVDRVAGRRFRVRVGQRGRWREPDAEAIEDQLHLLLQEETAACGLPARIDLVDPDVVLAVETIGDAGGIGFVTRDLRARHPLVGVP